MIPGAVKVCQVEVRAVYVLENYHLCVFHSVNERNTAPTEYVLALLEKYVEGEYNEVL
jgi:hypothetical protein